MIHSWRHVDWEEMVAVGRDMGGRLNGDDSVIQLMLDVFPSWADWIRSRDIWEACTGSR